jgi:hypothetical protein
MHLRNRFRIFGTGGMGCMGGCMQPCETTCDMPAQVREFDCGGTQRVVRHQHIVRHRHDTINEYDVVHQHEYNTFDVVRERTETCHNDRTTHRPNYCGTDGCDTMSIMPV